MMIHKSIKILSINIIFALTMAACSPLSPSVSKLGPSNKQTSETHIVDPKTVLIGNEVESPNTISHPIIEEKKAEVFIVSSAEFDTKWESLSLSRPSEKLSETSVSKFIRTGSVSFNARDKRIVGSEANLIHHSVAVYIVVKNLTAEIREDIQNSIEAKIIYRSISDAGKFKLRLTQYDSRQADPIVAIRNEHANKMSRMVRQNTIAIAIRFLED